MDDSFNRTRVNRSDLSSEDLKDEDLELWLDEDTWVNV